MMEQGCACRFKMNPQSRLHRLVESGLTGFDQLCLVAISCSRCPPAAKAGWLSMIELRLLADFCQPLFPIAFVRERIGVRAPQFFHDLALRGARTFRSEERRVGKACR